MAKKRASRRKKSRSTARRRTRRRAAPAKVAKPSKKKANDIAAMYLAILIVGVVGIILLFANPTETMRKVIGVLLVILGIWGLLAKK